MIHGNLILHNIVDIDMTTVRELPSTVYDANGKGSPCPAYKITKIRFTSTTGETFEVQAFRSDV